MLGSSCLGAAPRDDLGHLERAEQLEPIEPRRASQRRSRGGAAQRFSLKASASRFCWMDGKGLLGGVFSCITMVDSCAWVFSGSSSDQVDL